MSDRRSQAGEPVRFRFGVFELDARTGELRKAGARVRLAGQPLRLLERLLSRPGDLITRDELRHELWSDDTFVDFEHNLNSAMKRLRAALGDSAENPRFIETLPRRGYRFVIPVERIVAPSDPPEHPTIEAPPAPPERHRTTNGRWLATAATLVLIVSAAIVYLARREPAAPYRSIAVLPFVLAADTNAEDEYLAFGLSEALITQLSRLGGLRVISQTSSMQYKDAGKPLPRIADELGVDVVVEGSVQREGSRIRITVQLIEAATDAHLWADTFEREIGSVLALIDEVALAVAEKIHLQVARPDVVRTSTSRPVDPGVADAYLKGRYHLGQGTEADFQRALRYFEQALGVDPSHAPSHTGLAAYYIVTDAVAPGVASEKARFHARRALELDDTLPDAHASLAFLHFYYDWDWAAAERSFRRAIELNPGHARALRWYGLFLSAMGRHAEALDRIAAALASDPIAIANHDAAATVRFNARQFTDSVATGRSIHDLNAFDPRGYEHIATGLIQLGQYAEALAQAEKGLQVMGSNIALELIRLAALPRVGRAADADRALAVLEQDDPGGYVPGVFIAISLTALGRHAAALDRLEQAYAERDAYLVLLNVSPWFDPLRSDPRFVRLRERLKFPG
jgi:TolB-like protein/DNA-binding winged helix-turn-helix (wHTH) protein/Tfp pilus assembly protein PilF